MAKRQNKIAPRPANAFAALAVEDDDDEKTPVAIVAPASRNRQSKITRLPAQQPAKKVDDFPPLPIQKQRSVTVTENNRWVASMRSRAVPDAIMAAKDLPDPLREHRKKEEALAAARLQEQKLAGATIVVGKAAFEDEDLEDDIQEEDSEDEYDEYDIRPADDNTGCWYESDSEDEQPAQQPAQEPKNDWWD